MIGSSAILTTLVAFASASPIKSSLIPRLVLPSNPVEICTQGKPNGAAVASSAFTYNLYCNQDFSGNDVAVSHDFSTTQACIDWCSSLNTQSVTPFCYGVSFVPSWNNACYAKNGVVGSVGPNTLSNGLVVNSALLVTNLLGPTLESQCMSSPGSTFNTVSGGKTYTVGCYQDLVGNDVTGISNVYTLEDCIQKCTNLNTPGSTQLKCYGAAFVPTWNMCYTKSSNIVNQAFNTPPNNLIVHAVKIMNLLALPPQQLGVSLPPPASALCAQAPTYTVPGHGLTPAQQYEISCGSAYSGMFDQLYSTQTITSLGDCVSLCMTINALTGARAPCYAVTFIPAWSSCAIKNTTVSDQNLYKDPSLYFESAMHILSSP